MEEMVTPWNIVICILYKAALGRSKASKNGSVNNVITGIPLII